ncbi:MAG: hypothetical protein IJS08_17150 [Victivallales bacterium]|nr:hypothetical protein [Victivallales bacterium]
MQKNISNAVKTVPSSTEKSDDANLGTNQMVVATASSTIESATNESATKSAICETSCHSIVPDAPPQTATSPEPAFHKNGGKKASAQNDSGKKAGVFQTSNVLEPTNEELEKTVKNLLQMQHTSGQKTGEALFKLKARKAHKEYKPGVKTTFADYCNDVFGITPQYANRLIRAYRCYERTKDFFDKDGRSEEFGQLPENADLYEQLSKFKEDEQGQVLENLVDERKAHGETPDKICATDIKDLLTKTEDDSNNNSVKELALDTLKAISSNKPLLDKIANLKSTEMKLFAKALQERISKADRQRSCA